MGQTACMESCRDARSGETQSCHAVDDHEKALPRLLGLKEDSREVEKSSAKDVAKENDAQSQGVAEVAVDEAAVDPVLQAHAVGMESGTSMGASTEELKVEGQSSKNQRKLERTEARKQVLPFLLQNGFQTVKSKKTFLWRSCYPLHVAVKKKDIESVQLLLKAGADPQKLNHRSETARQLAERLNRSGSHQEIIDLLQGAKVRRRKSGSSTDMESKAQQARSSTTSLEITPRGV
ncbi:unnamed protein product [Effrenium voratum]|uniref:Uncharacterized protein n=1 Tax=Effrenium voratum TaxID=2562239 RepID=A0AA36NK15_9DINO|nr:unnamed protein product [Effrenium voratum]